MSATHVLVSLFGEIALLLWGVQTVRQGVLGSFGSDLRERLARGLKRPLQAVAAGFGVTAVLQSSTATAFMVTSLAADGVIALAPALAVMLGANIGTALVAQLLSFDVSWLFALLIGCGFVTTRRSRSAPGLTLQADTSVNLLQWSLNSAPLTGPPVDQGDGTELVTFRHPTPSSGQVRQYIRLRIQSN